MSTFRDLDQSGTYRTIVVACGPTFGLVRVPVAIETFFLGPGDYTIQPWDTIIIVRQTLTAPCNIIFPDVSVWMNNIYGATSLIIKDGAGQAGNNNITQVPFGSQVFEGVSKITTNFGSIQSIPLPDLSGWMTIGGS